MSTNSNEDFSMKELIVRRSDSVELCQYCPERPYIEIEAPQDAQQILRIRFSIRSHDQGWCDMYKDGPPYANSFTWFEVNAQIPEGKNYLPRMRVQYNRRADAEPQTHVILWDCEGQSPEISDWLRALRPGDTIQLIGRAQLRAWVNFIEEAEIKIEYTPLETPIRLGAELSPINSDHHWKPLDHASHEIRLLVIRPGSFDSAIVCFMVHTKLLEQDHERFRALSYCWGDCIDCATVRMECHKGSFDFTINQSAENALRHLRSPATQTTIWIDSICINQNNLAERAEQVKIMAQIYSQADAVEIWLGEGDRGAHLSLKMIRDIYNFNNNICPGGVECRCQGTGHSKSWGTHVPKSTETSYKMVREVFDLYADDIRTLPTFMTKTFGNPWFRRVWVVQEAINSQKANVHCGHESIPWEELIEVNRYLDSPDREEDIYVEPQDQIPTLWSTLIRVKQTLRQAEMDGKTDYFRHPGILEVFLEGLDLKASDPRDKLFALLPFGRETSSADRLPRVIAPDYKKTPERVFADFTRWWILEHRSLHILSAIHGQTGRQWQSSHCLTKPPPLVSRPTWTVKCEGKHKFAQATLAIQFGHRASGDLLPNETLLKKGDPLLLRLRGFRVSVIEEIAHLPSDGEYKDLHGLQEAFEKIFDPRGSSTWWTSPKLRGGTMVLSSAEGFLESTSRFRDHQRAHWQYSQRPKLSVLDLAVEKDHNGHYRRRETDSVPPCVDRCFFVTTKGLLGLCPSTTRKGDVVVVLFGGNVPFILRPSESIDDEERFELIGECYVRGIMNGEFIDEQRQKEGIPETFTLL